MSFYENFPQTVQKYLNVEVHPDVVVPGPLWHSPGMGHWCVGFVVEDRSECTAEELWSVYGEPAAISMARLINKGYRRPQFVLLEVHNNEYGVRGSYLQSGGLCFRWTQQYVFPTYSRCPFHETRANCASVHCLFQPRRLHDEGTEHFIDALIRETA